MKPEDLEKILRLLPEPNIAEVVLIDKFDYSSAILNVEADLGVRLNHSYNVYGFELKDPSIQNILDVVKLSYYGHKNEGRKIDICKITWYYSPVRIELVLPELGERDKLIIKESHYDPYDPSRLPEFLKNLFELDLRKYLEVEYSYGE